MGFSSFTASFLMAFFTSSNVWLASEPPALRVRSLRSCSSQHSSSWMTSSFPLIFVASVQSFQRERKYDQSSLDPASDIVGRLTFSIFAACCVVLGVAVCAPFE